MARKDTARMKRKGLLSGLSEEQIKERKRLVTQKLKEMASNEGKPSSIYPNMTLSLTPQGERVLKQKGGINKIIAESGPTGRKKNKYLFETYDDKLPPVGALAKYEGTTKAETRQNIT